MKQAQIPTIETPEQAQEHWENNATLIISDSWGVFIPQRFAEMAPITKDCDMRDALAVVAQGPENDYYWETWEDILNNWESVTGSTLYQNGDLWLLDKDFFIYDGPEGMLNEF